MNENKDRDKFLIEVADSFRIYGREKEVFLNKFAYVSDKDYGEKLENKEIAKKLHISSRTVSDYVRKIYIKLNENNEKFCSFNINLSEQGRGKQFKVHSHLWGNLYEEWSEKKQKNISRIKSIGLFDCHIKSTEIFPIIGNSIQQSNKEIWFFGTNFRLSLPGFRDIILDKIKNTGITIYFLVFNPKSNRLDELANDFGQTSPELKQECSEGLKSLLTLKKQLVESSANPDIVDKINIRLSNSFPRMRAYIFDPLDKDKNSIFIPYINQVDSPDLPAYICKNVPGGISQAYYNGIRAEWRRARDFDINQ